MKEAAKETPAGLNPVFQRSLSRARGVIQKRFRVLNLVSRAYERATRHDASLARVRGDLGALIRLARAWAKREYTAIPWKSILYAVAALLYFVNPIDLIPDAIIGLGFVDDVAVVAAVVSAIRKEVDEFEAWESSSRLPKPGAPKQAA